MISVISNVKGVMDIRGLSTDEKPVEEMGTIPIKNSSSFFEMDTGTVYMYSEETHEWLRL